MYKILSIDGGGMHGYACLTILRRLLEKKPNLLQDVDLIAGTSIGGILGLGLAMGHSIDEADYNFIKGFPLAFNTNVARYLGFLAGICPKYDNSKFKKFLYGIYGSSKLKDIKKKVVIPTFCIDDERPVHRRWRAKIFHNFEENRFNSAALNAATAMLTDAEASILDVAMATSAVPIFFPMYDRYVDGALIANNPALCAVSQTQDPRNKEDRPRLNDVYVLSIGSIRDIYITERNSQWGYFMWARSLLSMITERDTLVVNYMANLLLGQQYHRVEPVINGPMDNFEELANIKQIGMDYPLEDTYTWLDKYWR